MYVYVFIHTFILLVIYAHIYIYVYTKTQSFIFSSLLNLSSIFPFLPIYSNYHEPLSLSPKDFLLFSCREGLLEKISLTFCLPTDIFIPLSFWKDSFIGYRIISCFVLFCFVSLLLLSGF